MENTPKKKLTITQLAADDRPREKMMKHGARALSNAELLGILIGSGNTDETAVELCQRILNSADNSLNRLGKYDIKKTYFDVQRHWRSKSCHHHCCHGIRPTTPGRRVSRTSRYAIKCRSIQIHEAKTDRPAARRVLGFTAQSCRTTH